MNAVRGLFFGLSLAIGTGGERLRWGAGADATAQWLGESPTLPLGPTGAVEAHVGFVGRALFSEVLVGTGALVQSGDFDGGYQTLVGLRAGVGLGLTTDGAAGPVVAGAAQLPYLEGRVTQGWRDGGFDAPRVGVGLQVNTDCCSTLTAF